MNDIISLIRSPEKGETWFLGETAVFINFFEENYATHADCKSSFQEGVHGGTVWWPISDDDYAAVGVDLVEEQAISMLSLPFKGRFGAQYRFGITLTNVSYLSPISTVC
jgi:hypothetical protein